MSAQYRPHKLIAGAVAFGVLLSGGWTFGQTVNRRFTYRPNSAPVNERLQKNDAPAGQADISPNPIIQPIPLSAGTRGRPHGNRPTPDR